jgi:hypothetical protein
MSFLRSAAAKSLSTTQDATNFVNAFNTTNYLESTNYIRALSLDFYNATGHYPSTYKEYMRTEGSVLHVLIWYDNIIETETATVTS